MIPLPAKATLTQQENKTEKIGKLIIKNVSCHKIFAKKKCFPGRVFST